MLRLTLPTEFSQENVDTTRWKIDKNYLNPNHYYYYVIEIMFSADAVELSRQSRANVLSLGLGGGTMNGFLRYNFPEMNITVVEISAQMINLAKKWFDLQIDDHHRVIHADGVAFLKQQADTGMKYDAVLLDACYSTQETAENFICPVDLFLEEHVISSIAQVLSQGGVFITDIAPMTMSFAKARKMVLRRFSKFFTNCRTNRKMASKGNEVVYCMHQRPSKNQRINLFKFLHDNPL
ncbi:hypothetical protein Y032_0462g1891 [Ancylostoma ceylanicum]|nr:hypothetical protein Y032_0462g1891 [Ancylostoma ceylanicum]